MLLVKRLLNISFLLIIFALPEVSNVLADGAQKDHESTTEVLTLIRPYNLVEGEIEIVGEKVYSTNSTVWPVTFYFQFNSDRCTATFVGPRVFLTASHCLGERKMSGQVALDELQFDYDCYPDTNIDIAACVIADHIMWPPHTRFETVNSMKNHEPYSGDLEGRNIVLVGFGCRSIGGCPLDHPLCWHGQLFYGVVRVKVEMPFLLSQGQDVATCNGDSGGGSYLELGQNQRLLVGINSTSDSIGDTTLVATHSQDVQTFLERIIKANDVSICGKNLGGGDCVQY